MTLQEWISERGCSHGDVGRALGVHRQSVHLWATGQRRPGIYYAMALVELTQGAVPLESWLTAKDRAALAGLRAQHDLG